MSLRERLEALSGLPRYEKPPPHSGLRMDSNENMALPERFQRDVMDAARRRVDARQYPAGATERVARAISSYLRVPAQMITVGNGSDQILDMLLGHLAERGDAVLATDPAFSFFVDRCALHGMEMVRVPYGPDMTVSVDGILEASARADMVYLDSPNNPTGHQIRRADLRRLAESFGGIIILDEAYAEFGGYSAYRMPKRYPNVVVVRTLSKSFGMAGLRVGYMVADRAISEVFGRVLQYPYPISAVSAEAAVLALERAGEAAATWDVVREERSRMISTLRGYEAFRVFDSDANFVLFDAGRACRRIHKALAEQGIAVRLLGRVGASSGCLRVSVGTKSMNSRFLLAVRDLLK